MKVSKWINSANSLKGSDARIDPAPDSGLVALRRAFDRHAANESTVDSGRDSELTGQLRPAVHDRAWKIALAIVGVAMCVYLVAELGGWLSAAHWPRPLESWYRGANLVHQARVVLASLLSAVGAIAAVGLVIYIECALFHSVEPAASESQ